MKWKCGDCGSESMFIWMGAKWCPVCDFVWWAHEQDDEFA